MKISLLSENLNQKLSFVNHAVSPRSQLPILSNLLLEAKSGKLKISATDLEIGIQVEIPANVEEEGSTTVPSKIFLELINSLPAGKITLSKKNETLEVLGTNSKSTLSTMAVDEFPKLFEEKGDRIIDIKSKDFKKDLSTVFFAASMDTGRPALSGVLIKKEDGAFTMVATDGYRLSLRKKTSGIQLKKEKNEEALSLLVPVRVIREILNLKDEDEDLGVFVSKDKNQILFTSKDSILVGRLIEADFPNYQKIIPDDKSVSISFDKEELQKAVKICSIFARETANIVKISIKKNKLTISANTPSVGENSVEVEGSLMGEENEIAFNARYLLELLSNIDASELVFEMTGPLNPGVFKVKDDANFLHLIMPIRIQNTT